MKAYIHLDFSQYDLLWSYNSSGSYGLRFHSHLAKVVNITRVHVLDLSASSDDFRMLVVSRWHHHWIDAQTCLCIILRLTVWIEFGVIKLSIAQLGQNLLPKASATFCHRREHPVARVYKFPCAHEPWVLARGKCGRLVLGWHLLAIVVSIWSWLAHPITTKTTNALMVMLMLLLQLGVTTWEKSVVAKFLGQLMHIAIVIKDSCWLCGLVIRRLSLELNLTLQIWLLMVLS